MTNVKAFIIPCLLPMLFSGHLQGLKQTDLTSAGIRSAHALTKAETKRPCFYLSDLYLFIYLFCRAFNIASRARDIIQGNVKALKSRLALAKSVESRFATEPGWPTNSLIARSLLSLFPPKALDPKDDAKVSQPRSRQCLYACAQLFACACTCA